MYDKDRFSQHINLTVAQLISILQQLPQNAKVNICGDDYCYIHVETDNTVVNLDNEPLDENYENS